MQRDFEMHGNGGRRTWVMGQRNMGLGSELPRLRPWWLLPSCPMGRSAGGATEGDAYADGGGTEWPPLKVSVG